MSWTRCAAPNSCTILPAVLWEAKLNMFFPEPLYARPRVPGFCVPGLRKAAAVEGALLYVRRVRTGLVCAELSTLPLRPGRRLRICVGLGFLLPRWGGTYLSPPHANHAGPHAPRHARAYARGHARPDPNPDPSLPRTLALTLTLTLTLLRKAWHKLPSLRPRFEQVRVTSKG